MVHGSNMTRGHRGMRKGLSLMEMLVAIVLLGLIGTIGYNYYKNYYDTSFAAKQARIYVIVDQATQIRNAWDLYNTKNGEDPTVFSDFITDRILTEVPVAQPLISAAGWQVAGVGVVAGAGAYGEVDLDASAGGTNDYAIMMPMDGTASDADKVDYCNILNNTADTSWSLDPAVSDIAAQPNDPAGGYGQNAYFYCFDKGATDLADNLVIGFTYRVDPI